MVDIYKLTAIFVGFVVSLVLTKLLIPFLKEKQFGQFIREEGPQSHQSKAGTPTMGGVAIFMGMVAGTLAVAYNQKDAWVILVASLLFGLIGFLDDFMKVAKKHNLGLRAWQKLVLQIAFGIGLGVYMITTNPLGSNVFIPVYNGFVDFGFFYVPFVCLVMVAMSNSVNFSDGLDGLCSSVTLIVALFLSHVSGYFMNQSTGAFGMAVVGACLGFLVFNKYPAKIFMGDTGSMALGGGIAAAAIVMKAEFLLPIAGIIYVAEALSVIIQVGYYKKTKKRIFRMAPIHHHFEEGGMKETDVVRMFVIVTIIACAIGVGALYL